MTSGDLKRALLSVLVVGALAWITIPRTYAVFNTDSRNGASISSGTLISGLSTNGGADCDSASGTGNQNTTCTALMTFSPSTEYYPGGAAATATVTITNKGTLNATELDLDMPSCSKTATTDAPAAQQGATDPCATTGGVTLTVYETTAGNAHCVYPNTSGTCTPSPTLKDLRYFAQTYTDSSASLSLGSGPAGGNGTRSFTISLAYPATAPNSVQGTTVNFTLEWVLKNGN